MIFELYTSLPLRFRAWKGMGGHKISNQPRASYSRHVGLWLKWSRVSVKQDCKSNFFWGTVQFVLLSVTVMQEAVSTTKNTIERLMRTKQTLAFTELY